MIKDNCKHCGHHKSEHGDPECGETCCWGECHCDNFEVATEPLAIDKVYTERAQCVAALSKLFPSWWADGDETRWPVIYIDLPTGQVSWHVVTWEFDEYFTHLVDRKRDIGLWDGHDTEEKYRRLNTLQETGNGEETRWAKLYRKVRDWLGNF